MSAAAVTDCGGKGTPLGMPPSGLLWPLDLRPLICRLLSLGVLAVLSVLIFSTLSVLIFSTEGAFLPTGALAVLSFTVPSGCAGVGPRPEPSACESRAGIAAPVCAVPSREEPALGFFCAVVSTRRAEPASIYMRRVIGVAVTKGEGGRLWGARQWLRWVRGLWEEH